MKRLDYAKNIELHENVAIKAMFRGEASKEQQKFFMDCLLEKICMSNIDPFHEGSQRIQDHNLGRQSVWRALVYEKDLSPDFVLAIDNEKEKIIKTLGGNNVGRKTRRI